MKDIWNITEIKEGKIYEHKQTGQLVFVQKQPDVITSMGCIKTAIEKLFLKTCYKRR